MDEKNDAVSSLIQSILAKTNNWYPNEYVFISEEFFRDLHQLAMLTKRLDRGNT